MDFGQCIFIIRGAFNKRGIGLVGDPKCILKPLEGSGPRGKRFRTSQPKLGPNTRNGALLVFFLSGFSDQALDSQINS